MILFGAGIKSGRYEQAASPADIAPTLARICARAARDGDRPRARRSPRRLALPLMDMTRSRRFSRAGLGLALAAAIAAPAAPAPRAQNAPGSSGLRFAVTQPGSLRAADAQVESMRRGGELELAQIAADSLIAGRTHERLLQRYRGLPVFGGVTRCARWKADSVRTIFGRVYPGITIPTEPASSRDRGRLARSPPSAAPKRLGARPCWAFCRQAAANGARVADSVRSGVDVRDIFVNAVTGAIERNRSSPPRSAAEHRCRHRRRRRRQESVGDGQLPGLRCDRSLAARHAGHIRLRGIAESRLNAFLLNGVLFDADRAFDSDNTWIDGAVVDAHVYQGWTYDYYFKRFGRNGMDDRNLALDTSCIPSTVRTRTTVDREHARPLHEQRDLSRRRGADVRRRRRRRLRLLCRRAGRRRARVHARRHGILVQPRLRRRARCAERGVLGHHGYRRRVLLPAGRQRSASGGLADRRRHHAHATAVHSIPERSDQRRPAGSLLARRFIGTDIEPAASTTTPPSWVTRSISRSRAGPIACRVSPSWHRAVRISSGWKRSSIGRFVFFLGPTSQFTTPESRRFRPRRSSMARRAPTTRSSNARGRPSGSTDAATNHAVHVRCTRHTRVARRGSAASARHKAGGLLGERGFIGVSVGGLVTSNNFDATVDFSLYREPTSFDTSYDCPAGLAFDVSGGVKVWRHLGVAVAVSRHETERRRHDLRAVAASVLLRSPSPPRWPAPRPDALRDDGPRRRSLDETAVEEAAVDTERRPFVRLVYAGRGERAGFRRRIRSIRCSCRERSSPSATAPRSAALDAGEALLRLKRQFAVGGGARFSRATDDVETGTDQSSRSRRAASRSGAASGSCFEDWSGRNGVTERQFTRRVLRRSPPHSTRPRRHLRRHRAAGGASRRGPRGRAISCAKADSPAYRIIASSPRADAPAATAATRH